MSGEGTCVGRPCREGQGCRNPWCPFSGPRDGDLATGGVNRYAIEGIVVERDRTRFPQAIVESLTEYDYADLPAGLREPLEDWCDAFAALRPTPEASR